MSDHTKNLSVSSSSRSSRLAIICIVGFPFLVFLAAVLFFFFADKVGLETTNNGRLIEPAQSVAGLGQGLESKQWQLVLLVDGAVCDNDCRDKLAIVRNAHWALGKEAHRVARATLFVGDGQSVDHTVTEIFPEVVVAAVATAQFQSWREPVQASVTSPWQFSVLVVDPLGNAFLYYDTTHTGNHLLIDMRKLLKFSRL